VSEEHDWASPRPLDWGPTRPPAIGWAGSLLLILGIAQLGAIGTAVVLERDLIATRPQLTVIASVLAFLGLHVLVAIGVLRMWRWWRGIAILFAVLGVALQAANLAGPPDEPVVVGINAGLGVVYIIVVVLLWRVRA
jgi:hypothetical protein